MNELKNPALDNFITSAKTEKKKNADRLELWQLPEQKTQRAQLLLQPTIVKLAKEAAADQLISFNEYVNQALIQRLTEEGRGKK